MSNSADNIWYSRFIKLRVNLGGWAQNENAIEACSRRLIYIRDKSCHVILLLLFMLDAVVLVPLHPIIRATEIILVSQLVRCF